MANSSGILSKISVFLFLLLMGLTVNLEAQNRRGGTDDYFDEGGFGPHRLWYGGGVGLGFSGGSAFGRSTSEFRFSLSPMVGYKLTPELSIGPRAEIEYTHFRISRGNNSSDRFNFFNYGIGAFARYKIFSPFFLHTEFQLESLEELFTSGETRRRTRENFFLGGGYYSGTGLIGYEISFLWNLIDDGSADLPLDIRIAFTYNF